MRSEEDLGAGPGGDPGVGHHTSGGDVEQVDAVRAQFLGEADGVVAGPALALTLGVLGQPIAGPRAEEDRQLVGQHLADGVDDLEGEAEPVLEPAAEGVGAVNP